MWQLKHNPESYQSARVYMWNIIIYVIKYDDQNTGEMYVCMPDLAAKS